MKPDPGFERAYEDALAALARRDYFENELRAMLDARGHSGRSINLVIDRLNMRKLLSDRKTIQTLCERYSGKRAIGPLKLKAELERRGAPENLVEETLSVYEGEYELDAALEAAEGRAFKSRAQLARFLVSRGFTDSCIESVVERLFGETD
jgi:regulatory protein